MLELLQSTNVYWLAIGVVGGMIVGGLMVQGLRQRWKMWPQATAWQLAAYGGGIFLGGSLLGGCILFLGGGGLGAPPAQLAGTPTPTPTATRARPTATPTPVKSRATPTPTPTPTPPVLPSTFDMTLNATNGTCGSGTSQHPYTFTIEGSTLILLQVDANITTTGPYDPATGAFNTTAPVGPGTEYYTGTITFDGTLISVTGQSAYTQPGLQCTNDIAGETTVP